MLTEKPCRHATSPPLCPRMSTRPVIFISAVSKELHTARDLIAKTLLALGYEPKWQDIAATETGDLRAVLRKWIDDSDAVLQLIGHCYGFAPTSPDPQFGPCSYTQYEALYARQQHKPVYYIFTDDTHPTDGCACGKEPQPLHALQQTYRQTVKSYGALYHTTSSLTQTELIVRRLKDDLAHLRKRGKQYAALVLGLLVVLVLGGALMIQSQSESKQKIEGLSQQNDKLLQALRDLPQTLSQQPRTNAKEDETIRIARAYSELETQLKHPPGSLAKELPQFAQQLLQRADTSALDRANALFATQKFAEAEAEALKAKDHALAFAGQHAQDAIDALLLAGQSAQEQIHYFQAMEYYRAAAVLTSRQLNFLQWLGTQNAISNLYHLMGRYPESLANAQQAWQIARQAGQDEASEVLAAHSLYARSLDVNGQSAIAELEYRTVLKLQEHALGIGHRYTLATRGNLANALYSQEKYAEAEQEYRVLMKLQEGVLDKEHSETLMCRMNLANALDAQGKHAEAEQEHQMVLRLKTRVLGAGHPETLMSQMNLAIALDEQGKHVEAEQHYRIVVELSERALGADHPDVARSLFNLALCLEAQQKMPDAVVFMHRSEQIYTRILGPDHPDAKAARTAREHIEAALK